MLVAEIPRFIGDVLGATVRLPSAGGRAAHRCHDSVPYLVRFEQRRCRAVLAEYSQLEARVVVDKRHHIAAALVVERRAERPPRVRVRELPRKRGDNGVTRLRQPLRHGQLADWALRHRRNLDVARTLNGAPASVHVGGVQTPSLLNTDQARCRASRRRRRESTNLAIRLTRARTARELRIRGGTRWSMQSIRAVLEGYVKPTWRTHDRRSVRVGAAEHSIKAKAAHILRRPEGDVKRIADEDLTHTVVAVTQLNDRAHHVVHRRQGAIHTLDIDVRAANHHRGVRVDERTRNHELRPRIRDPRAKRKRRGPRAIRRHPLLLRSSITHHARRRVLAVHHRREHHGPSRPTPRRHHDRRRRRCRLSEMDYDAQDRHHHPRRASRETLDMLSPASHGTTRAHQRSRRITRQRTDGANGGHQHGRIGGSISRGRCTNVHHPLPDSQEHGVHLHRPGGKRRRGRVHERVISMDSPLHSGRDHHEHHEAPHENARHRRQPRGRPRSSRTCASTAHRRRCHHSRCASRQRTHGRQAEARRWCSHSRGSGHRPRSSRTSRRG